MLRLDTTYVQRENTNEAVYELARARSSKEILKLSECYTKSKLKLYAKLVVAPETDPRKNVVFADASLRPNDHGNKKGRKTEDELLNETTQLFWKRYVKPQMAHHERIRLVLREAEHVTNLSTCNRPPLSCEDTKRKDQGLT